MTPRLKSFSRIFSTNYDLLSYWPVFSDKNSFTDRWVKKADSWDFLYNDYSECQTHIYFLHGAFYLGTDKNGNFKKLERDDDQDLLGKLKKVIQDGTFLPLYVAEGSSQEKLEKIKKVPYLNMVYEKFRKMEKISTDKSKIEYIEDLIVIGHSLNPKFDEHIVDAISSSPIKNIYYGVHHPSTSEEVEKCRLQKMFKVGKEIYCFDSSDFFKSEGSIFQDL